MYNDAIKNLDKSIDLLDFYDFSKKSGLKATLLKKVRPYITEKDENAKALDEADKEIDTEIIPFNYDGGIDGFMKKEVLPYASDSYIDENKTEIGYEISFTKYFYKPKELRDIKDIIKDINKLENESNTLLKDIVKDL